MLLLALALGASLRAQPVQALGSSAPPTSGWERWSRKDLGGFAGAQVLRFKGAILAVTHGALFRLDPERRVWSPFGEPRSYDAAMVFGSDLLTSSRELGLARLDAGARVVERVPNPLSNPREFRKILRDGAGRIWIVNKRAVIRLEGSAGQLRMIEETVPGLPACDACGPGEDGTKPPKTPQAADIEVDSEGRPWIGYAGGLARLNAPGRWGHVGVRPPFSDVRSLALGDRVIWVAGRNSDAFFRLTPDGTRWAAQKFEPADGYGPKETFFIKRDSRGWIWRGSTDGVHVSDGAHLGPEDWLHLGADNGLACGEADNYGFFEDEDGSVWVAGDQGITHLKPDPAWFAAPGGIPEIKATEQLVGGLLEIRLEGAHLSPFREYPFRCALGSGPWVISTGGGCEFRGVKDGTYALKFGYTGNGAAISSRQVRIGPSILRLSMPYALASLLALALIAACLWKLDRFELFRYRMAKALFILRRRIVGHVPEVEDANPPAADLTGRTLLDRYEVLEAVAHGGFSTVYAALDRHSGGKAAIKHLRAASGQVRERFTKEVAALRSIRHAGIVEVLDSWIDAEGEACLAMPFLDGPTLRHRLKSSRIYPRAAAGIVRAVGAALAEMHARGIVHRDIKPENIILTGGRDCIPVLIDFGIAGLRDRHGRLSATRTLAGSYLYMAPESMTGHYSTATDVYSFAVLILEMLSGKKLLDIEAEFHDPEFVLELTDALNGVMEKDDAASLAGILAKAYDPAPAKRPPVEPWTARILGVLTRSP